MAVFGGVVAALAALSWQSILLELLHPVAPLGSPGVAVIIGGFEVETLGALGGPMSVVILCGGFGGGACVPI